MTDTTQTPANVADVEEALRDVVDPELGINVVDLGLIYGITVDSESTAIIDMTLTSAACPLTDVDAWLIEQPCPSYDTSSTTPSTTFTRTVTSSPQVGLTWCTSASNGSRSPARCGRLLCSRMSCW